jgi:hypothetical protein
MYWPDAANMAKLRQPHDGHHPKRGMQKILN